MQLFAFNLYNQLVAAIHADKHCDYYCVECRNVVRLRGGYHRQKHYYHLQADPSCSLHRKSMEHIQVQTYLYHLFSPNDCLLECPFPEISRIADVVWISKKWVFEVQCSPITQEEIQNRCQDYRKCGYEIVWILHDRTFNRLRLCAAEMFLQTQTHYFTNIDKEGKGHIYDSYAYIEKGMRKYRMKPVPVQVNDPIKLDEQKGFKLFFIKNRMETWKLHFAGDLVSLFFDQNNSTARAYFQEIRKIELTHRKKALSWQEFWREKWNAYIVRPYRLIFQLLLEKHCN